MRPFDPRYPRLLRHAQAEAAHWRDALLERTVRGVEAVMNGRVERAPDVHPLGSVAPMTRHVAGDEHRFTRPAQPIGATGLRCAACGTTTYGYSLSCGKCGRAR